MVRVIAVFPSRNLTVLTVDRICPDYYTLLYAGEVIKVGCNIIQNYISTKNLPSSHNYYYYYEGYLV